MDSSTACVHSSAGRSLLYRYSGRRYTVYELSSRLASDRIEEQHHGLSLVRMQPFTANALLGKAAVPKFCLNSAVWNKIRR